MRNPAIHIRRSDLIEILNSYGLYKCADNFMRDALKFSIRNRTFVATKSEGKKKAARFKDADTNVLEHFNQVYNGIMIARSIKVMPILKSHPQYLTLKEVCCQALEFNKLFELDQDTGFRLFITIGIELLGTKYSLYRLKGQATRIAEHYRDTQIISQDQTPEDTDQMIIAWETAVRTYFHKSLAIDINTGSVRIYFVHAKNDADSVKADYYDWMYAQFEKWSFLNEIPAWTQLYGDNAKLIYSLYMASIQKNKSTDNEKKFEAAALSNKEVKTTKSIQEEKIRKSRLQTSVPETGRGDD
jgi:hypothetical protein